MRFRLPATHSPSQLLFRDDQLPQYSTANLSCLCTLVMCSDAHWSFFSPIRDVKRISLVLSVAPREVHHCRHLHLPILKSNSKSILGIVHHTEITHTPMIAEEKHSCFDSARERRLPAAMTLKRSHTLSQRLSIGLVFRY